MLGLTLGDPAGIGPEVVLASLRELNLDLFGVIGPHCVAAHPKLKDIVDMLGFTFIKASDGCLDCAFSGRYWIEPDCNTQIFDPGHIHRDHGVWAYESLKLATELALKGVLTGIVTAPVSKTALSLLDLPGFDHTSLLKSLTGVPATRMAFFTDSLKTVLHTTHIPLREVFNHLNFADLTTTASLTIQWLTQLGYETPRIALAGLNPHAGEGGLIGDEEQASLIPFLARWNAHSPYPILGPFPPDTVFYRALMGEFDCVISLYHDQGLIPLKLIGFDDAVNATLGLPFIRTSPDHGTAFDIAYQNQASSSSMRSAIQLATRLSQALNAP